MFSKWHESFKSQKSFYLFDLLYCVRDCARKRADKTLKNWRVSFFGFDLLYCVCDCAHKRADKTLKNWRVSFFGFDAIKIPIFFIKFLISIFIKF